METKYKLTLYFRSKGEVTIGALGADSIDIFGKAYAKAKGRFRMFHTTRFCFTDAGVVHTAIDLAEVQAYTFNEERNYVKSNSV